MEERKWYSLGHLILIFPVFITAGKRKPAGFYILDFLDKCYLMNFHKYSTYKKYFPTSKINGRIMTTIHHQI